MIAEVAKPRPEDWVAKTPGMGSCFHQALHRWADLRARGDIWKIAIGIVEPNPQDPKRHLHAWLQRGARDTMSAVDGSRVMRRDFYRFVGVEPRSVRLVNPRAIMRASKGEISRETVHALLDEAGIPWRSDNGGIVPREAS